MKATNLPSSLPVMLGLIAGIAISLILLSYSFHDKQTNFEDAATFGAQTTSVFGSVNGYRIACGDARDAHLCIAGAVDRKADRLALLLGNSQVHAINQMQSGDVNVPILLHERLKAVGLDLVTFSQPNANLQEHWVLFEYLTHNLPIKVLILEVCFDDMREDGLRDDIATMLRDTQVHQRLAMRNLGKKIIGAKPEQSQNGGDTAGIQDTIQEKVERRLNGWLEEHSKVWKARPEMRGELMGGLFLFRNSVLGIKPTTKRKIIRGRYVDNMAALHNILETAAEREIRTVVYIAPIRDDLEPPYVEKEYAAFKTEVREITSRTGAVYANLETLVPAQFWGTKEATNMGGGTEVDFMHFQAAGHKLLAQRLSDLVVNAEKQP